MLRSQFRTQNSELKIQNFPRFITIALLIFILPSCSYYFGNTRVKRYKPTEQSTPLQFGENGLAGTDHYRLITPLMEHWADQDIPDWYDKGKVTAPRVIIGKLMLGRDIEEVNKYLMLVEPWGNIGSRFFLNPKGDYDFTMISLVAILHLFGNDPSFIYPETLEHLLNDLLPGDGGKPHVKTPHTLRFMRDTENHLLMVNVSRYLKNQWLFAHGGEEKYNNHNGLEDWIFELLQEMREFGLYEFNAVPYGGYTLSALETLYTFTNSDKIREECGALLDELHYEFALTSINFKRATPFRRRLENEGLTDLHKDPHVAVMKVYYLLFKGAKLHPTSIGQNLHQALIAAISSYFPPNEVMQILVNPQAPYYARISHGWKATPDIVSGGENWLLTAGGAQRGKRSQIVARPITLLFSEGSNNLDDHPHIQSDKKMKKWNNTGVWKNFAVAKGKLYVPEYLPEIESSGNWTLYDCSEFADIYLLGYQGDGFAIMEILDQEKYRSEDIVSLAKNINYELDLSNAYGMVSGSFLKYNLNAKAGKWVITEIDEMATDRDYDQWPRVKLE